jgi:hypothetical protein
MKSAPSLRIAILVLLAVAGLPPAHAQEGMFVCSGRLTDAEDRPLEGFRVVYRAVEDIDVSVSPPSDANGEYALSLPVAVPCAPVALISPRGRRIELEDQAPVGHGAASRRDIRLDETVADWPGVDPEFAGAERLYLAFAEDTTTAEKYRWEGRLDYADFDTAEVTLGRAIAAVSFEDLSDIELGASFGIGGVDFSGTAPDQGGVTDVDLWAKLRLDPHFDTGRTEWAVGAVLTLPTGDEDAGLGFDAFRSKLFGAVRIPFAHLSLAGHAGVRLNEDGMSAGAPLAGEIAPAAGVALTIPVRSGLVLVGELGYEGERFAGGEAESQGLLGVNWQALPHGTIRAAVAAGFDDGAADTRIFLGYSFDF